MKVLILISIFVCGAAFAQTPSGELKNRACGALTPRQKVVCGILIRQEIAANMGSVIEREGSRYLSRRSVMVSPGAYLSFFDEVQTKLLVVVPKRTRLEILAHTGSLSLLDLILQIDSTLIKK